MDMSKTLPQGWKKLSIDDILIDKISGEWGKECVDENEGVYVLRTTNFTNEGKLKLDEVVKRTIEEKKVEKKKLQYGDIILEKSGGSENQPVGRVVYFDIQSEDTYLCNNFTQILRTNPEIINSKYLLYVLFDIHRKGITEYFQNKTTGIRNLQIKSYLEQKINIPPLEEQERIVSILERADDAICKREESNRLLDEYLKSVFVDMFGDPVTNPKGWDKIKLKDFGKVVTGNTPSRKQEEYYGNYIEWIKSDNINTPYHYLTQAEEYLSEEGCSVGRKVPKGSILITCIAGSRSCIGNCAIANREVTFNQQINAIVPNEDINNNFLYTQLLVGKSIVQSYSTNSMKGMISKGVFENVEFMCPPTELQNEFGDIFDKINEMKNKCEEELLGLNNLFNSLMQRAFNGEL